MEDLIVNGIIKKMVHQIEMSTAEAPAVNVFRQNVNIFGKSIPLKTTFTFGTAQQNSSSDNSNVGKRNPEVNTTWTPYNEHMASPVNRGETFITWPKQIVQKPAIMLKESTSPKKTEQQESIRLLLHRSWRCCPMFLLWYISETLDPCRCCRI